MAFRVPYKLLSEDHKEKIRRHLQIVETPSYFNPKNKYRKANLKKISFYRLDKETGDIYLPMYFASKLFNKPLINTRLIHQKVPPFDMKCKLYDYQQEVVDISLNNFQKTGTTFLNVFCSYGKTVVAAYFAHLFSQQFGLTTLVTYHLLIIQNSWIGTFKNLTNCKYYVVGEDTGPIPDDVQVILCMNTRIHTIEQHVLDRVGHLVIDEADRFCTVTNVNGLLSVQPIYITALTATYERDDGFHVMLDLLVGKEKITRISTKPFFVFYVPTPYTVETDTNTAWHVVLEQLDNNMERNQQIIQMVVDNLEEKILVLTKHKEHANNLMDWTEQHISAYGKTVTKVIGNTTHYNDANVIIGTMSKLGIGFDEKEACSNWNNVRINMLIMCSSTKKQEQYVGRVGRSEMPIVVDIVDNHKNIKQHWRLRKKWYMSRNGIIITMKDRFSWALLKDNLIATHITKPAANKCVKANNIPKLITGSNNFSMALLEDNDVLAKETACEENAVGDNISTLDVSKSHLHSVLAKLRG